jgi:hypothetical protein
MSSAVNATNGGLYATSILTGAGGVVAKGIVVSRGDLISGSTGIFVTDEAAAGGAQMTFQSAPALPLTAQGAKMVVLSAGPLGTEGCLNVFTLNTAGAQVQTVASTQIPPRGVVGPPAITGGQAIWGLVAPSQSGVATIGIGVATIAVANTAVTAASIIMVTPTGAPDTTAFSFNITLAAGVGFTITANANANANKTVSWFVVRY